METRNLASTRTLYALTHLEWAGAVITVGERISSPQASSYRLGREVRSPEPARVKVVVALVMQPTAEYL